MFYLHPYNRIAWVMGNETVSCGSFNVNMRLETRVLLKKKDIELRIWLCSFSFYGISV